MRTELDRIAENNFARKQGLARGEAKGRAEEKRQTAKNFKELGVDFDCFCCYHATMVTRGQHYRPKMQPSRH